MKDRTFISYMRTPAVAPLGPFFCPEPRLENGSSHKYCEWSGVTPWNSSSTETETIGHDVVPRGK